MIPPRRITDTSFDYTRSDFTDIRRTFARMGWEPPSQQKQKFAHEQYGYKLTGTADEIKQVTPTEKGHDNGN